MSVIGKRAVTTLEGLGSPEKLHPVQQAFVHEQAAQCGYCANGWIMNTVALLEKNSRPTSAQIKQAFANVQCRCGTQIAIMRAVDRAAQNMKTADKA